MFIPTNHTAQITAAITIRFRKLIFMTRLPNNPIAPWVRPQKGLATRSLTNKLATIFNFFLFLFVPHPISGGTLHLYLWRESLSVHSGSHLWSQLLIDQFAVSGSLMLWVVVAASDATAPLDIQRVRARRRAGRLQVAAALRRHTLFSSEGVNAPPLPAGDL